MADSPSRARNQEHDRRADLQLRRPASPPEDAELKAVRERATFKNEQRDLIEQRHQQQKRIEALKREFQFIEKLDTRDVNYILDQKKEQAALIVQKTWRMKKSNQMMRQHLMKARKGIRVAELEDVVLTPEMKQAIRNEIKLVQQAREEQVTTDDFYRKLEQDDEDSIYEEMVAKRRQKTDDQVKQGSLLKSRGNYDQGIKMWMEDFDRNEEYRRHTQKKLNELEIMADNLAVLHPKEVMEIKAQEKRHFDLSAESVLGTRRCIQEDEKHSNKIQEESHAEIAKRELENLEAQMFVDSKSRLANLGPGWSHILTDLGKEEKEQAMRDHRERLAKFRECKDWKVVFEEDEEDSKGDQLIADIKNYKAEFWYNSRFYDQ